MKSYNNGRTLGGHMRSQERPRQLSYETESSDVSTSIMLSENDLLESETESSKNVINLTQKRSKRTWKLDKKTSQLDHSSASDTTTEEDLAFCLIMLSKDKWKKTREEDYKRLRKIKKGRYKCETCGKVFKSYQALGGHRASHKKNRVTNKTEQNHKTEHDNVVVIEKRRSHECPICLRVFTSGQALGGHKRSHGIGNNHHHHQEVHQIESMKQRMIDLNLPAPAEEDEALFGVSMNAEKR